MDRNIKAGTRLKHFKRELLTEVELQERPNMYTYEYLGTVTHSETKEQLVLYKALYDFDENNNPKLFVRPYEMFMSEVDHDKYPSIKQKYRFEEIL